MSCTNLLLCIIPARGGSKGIPGKNIKLLGGKPLLAYTWETAQRAGVFDRIVLSTDSEEIAAVGRKLGMEVPFMRPPELSEDDTPMLPVLQHAIMFLGERRWIPDYIAILQPSAPFRNIEHLREAYKIISESGCDSVVSVEKVPDHFSPHYAMKIVEGRLENFIPEGEYITRRQDVEMAYTRNGQFYFARRETIMEKNTIYGSDCRPFIIADEDSVNLDTLDNWKEAERLIVCSK